MAIYRLNTNNGNVGSASPHADYIMGEGKYDYKKNEVIYQDSHILSGISPREFWKLADDNEPVNGRTYREFKLSLPHEFSREENIALLNEFIEKELGKDYYYTVAIHDKESSEDGINNVHAHLMFSERKLDGIERNPEDFFKKFCYKNQAKGGAKKEPSWTKKSKLFEIRQSWEDVLNEHLEKKGIEKVSCKSLKEQRKEALENGDKAKAEFCNREAVHIPGYILKKDIDELELDELDQLNNYLLNKEILKKAKELYKEARASENKKDIFTELDSNIENIHVQLYNDRYTFDNFTIAESNFNMLQREIYKTEFLLQEENLVREVSKTVAPEYYNLVLKKDNSIDRYESDKSKNIDTDSEKFYQKLADIDERISSLPAPHTMPNFTEEKEKIQRDLEKSLEKYNLSLTKFRNELNDIKKKIGEDKFDSSILQKNFKSNLERAIECKYEIKQLDRKLASYNRNLDKEKLHQSAMNIYSKGEYNRVHNNFVKIKNELEILEPKVRYATGQTIEENEKFRKEYEVLKDKFLKANSDMKAFEKKYSSKNSQIKIQHIQDNMEKKYKELMDKALTDKKLLSVELALIHKRITNTLVQKSEVKNILNKYQINVDFAKANLSKKEAVATSLKKLLSEKHLTDTALNKFSKGRYFIIAKDYSKLATEYNSLTKQAENLKFYEFSKKFEINNQRKEIKAKLESLETEYKAIISSKNTPEYKEVYQSIKTDREIILSGINSEVKEFKNEVFENNEKDFIALGIEKEIPYVQDKGSNDSIYKPQSTYYDFENNEPESGGGGGFKILDEDEDRWSKKQRNVFERGFAR